MRPKEIQKDRKYPIFYYVVAFAIFVIPFWGLQYTSDWDGYNYFFQHPEDSRDSIFGILAFKFDEWGFEFIDLYRTHIILICILYLSLFKRLELNPILWALLLLLTNYVAIGNQIRYYVAFPSALIAFHYYLNNNKIKGIILSIISVLFHKTMILLFASWVLYEAFIRKKTITIQIILLFIANIVFLGLLNISQLFDEKFDSYQNAFMTSSILGGIFNMIPSIIFIIIILYVHYNMVKRNKPAIITTQYRFLITTSLASSMYILSGLTIQVLANRFIITLLPIWIGYLQYCKKNIYGKYQDKISQYIIILLLMILCWHYIVVPLCGFDHYFVELKEMILSYEL